MIFNIFIVLISLIFENIFNLYFSKLNYITPLFTLISLIFVFPYFKNSKKDFYIFSLLVGLIYDLVFTNFYIINSILFLLISIVIFYVLKNHEYNLLMIVITSILSIFLYNILLYLILNLYNYTNYSLIDLSYILKSFLIGNIFYCFIIYFLIMKMHIIDK